MVRMRVLSVVVAVLALSGCLSTTPDIQGPTDAPGGIIPVRERAGLPFRTDDVFSHTLTNGTFAILPAVSVEVQVNVPVGNGLPTQTVNLGLFRPDVPAGTRVPVIADVGPYYGDGDVPSTQPANRLGRFLIENFVPHGYAVAQVSVFGTGDSGGCMDLMGEVEQAGVQAAVEWLGTQDWSNGNVGLIGRSYDGSTPWEAAMAAGSAHLKTVVPISGLYGQHELMWRNGSAESRGPGLLWYLYYTFALTPTHTATGDVLPSWPVGGLVPRPEDLVPSPEYAPEHAQHLAEDGICPETQAGGAEAVAAYATGDRVAPQANTYWAERSFKEEVLANYEGSVYFIHGLQDWNVDPHMAFPFYQELEAKGLEMKGLFGQWGHMYPDRASEHENLPASNGQEAYPRSVRYDWAEDLLQWFDHYLKGTGPRPELHAEVQDAQGLWRIEDSYPPRDAAWLELRLGGDLRPEPGNPAAVLPGTAPALFATAQVPGSPLVYTSAPLAEATRIAGTAQFHVRVTPAGPGGQLYAELRDKDADLRLGHAIMDLRFAEGGNEARPVAPGVPIVARMEFFAADVLVPAGHQLELVVQNTGRDYLASAVSDPVVLDESGASILRIPTITRGDTAFFQPPVAGAG